MRIQGKNIAVLIGAPGEEKVVGLSTSCSIDLQTDMIEMASLADAFRSYTPGRHSMTIQIDRLVDTYNTLPMLSLQMARTRLSYIVEVEGGTVSGSAYISSQRAEAPVQGYATHNISLTCTGSVTIDDGFATFADSLVAKICAEKWGDGVHITRNRVAGIESIGTTFRGTTITSFVELQNFAGVKSIDDYAFQGCSSLKSIEIPRGSVSIGRESFKECASITLMRIPEDITEIGDYAFQGCSSLKRIVVVPSTPPVLGVGAFSGIPSDAKIYITNGNVSEYKSAPGWSNYADMIQQ